MPNAAGPRASNQNPFSTKELRGCTRRARRICGKLPDHEDVAVSTASRTGDTPRPSQTEQGVLRVGISFTISQISSSRVRVLPTAAESLYQGNCGNELLAP